MTVVRMTYPKLFAKMSGHFLVQELPDNWDDIMNEDDIEEWFSIYKINSNKRILILALSILGYDTRRVYKDTKLYKKLINAYKIRYLNEVDYNNNKILYNTIIGHLNIFLLTKN